MKEETYETYFAGRLGAVAESRLRVPQGICESRAVSREGKPLAGAAKASFLKKCKRDTCQARAVGSDGRLLVGAAKKSFMQKCQREA
jgi:hypothetical protein